MVNHDECVLLLNTGEEKHREALSAVTMDSGDPALGDSDHHSVKRNKNTLVSIMVFCTNISGQQNQKINKRV